MSEPTVTVTLTRRELTLIRVACLARLDRLALLDPTRSLKGYGDTRGLMNGKLWFASTELREREREIGQ